MKKSFLLLVLCVLCVSAYAAQRADVNEVWQRTVLAAVDSFPHNGGYFTGSVPTADFPVTAWRALNTAFVMHPADARPQFIPSKAQPSFCSIATYAVLVKALTMWDTHGVISRNAWLNMKPYVGIYDDIDTAGIGQDDGEGFWGRANANGPALGVLVHELKAGFSFTGYRGAKTEKYKETPHERYMTDDEWRADPVWAKAVPGDFMKIFWNRNDSKGSDSGAVIGINGNKDDEQEHGHSVVFLGYNNNGEVMYWSSNGPGSHPRDMGYGIGTCDKTKIQRVVFTRITAPQCFDNVRKIMPTMFNKWLDSLNGKHHGTTAELKRECGIK
jgi:hypothetical protein